jgi:hypothetical protein
MASSRRRSVATRNPAALGLVRSFSRSEYSQGKIFGSNAQLSETANAMAVLTGDTNADKFTDAIDVSQVKSQSGNAVTASNFREDVNVDNFYRRH